MKSSSLHAHSLVELHSNFKFTSMKGKRVGMVLFAFMTSSNSVEFLKGKILESFRKAFPKY